MGIKGLTALLCDNAPGCVKEQKFENYFGRKVAVDASMHIYQFLIVVGRQGDQLLSNEAGEVTSHLQGMFYRTARMLEAGAASQGWTSHTAEAPSLCCVGSSGGMGMFCTTGP
jgi:flap endonuclease-1